MTKKAPPRSKSRNVLLVNACFGSVKKHSIKNTAHMIEEIHISVRQPEISRMSPPRDGPKITAALEISI